MNSTFISVAMVFLVKATLFVLCFLYPFGLFLRSLSPWGKMMIYPSLHFIHSFLSNLPSIHYSLYLSSIALVLYLNFTKIYIKDQVFLDSHLPETLFLILGILGFIFRWNHIIWYYKWFGINEFSLWKYRMEIIQSAVKSYWLFCSITIVIMASLYFKLTKKSTLKAFIILYLITGSSSLSSLKFLKQKVLRITRGQRNYSTCYVYFIIGIFSAVFGLWLLRHEMVRGKEWFIQRFPVDTFETVPSSSSAFDSIYFGSMFGILLIFDMISLNHTSMSIWSLVYVFLIDKFGMTTFFPFFCLHIEYITQKYKSAAKIDWSDQILFIFLNGLLSGLSYYIVMHLPHDYVSTFWGNPGNCPYLRAKEAANL